MPNEGPALSVTQPVSVWNRAIGVDFRKFFVSLGKAVVAGKVGKWDSAVKSGIDTLASISLKDPAPGDVAWLLIRRTLEQSMTRLVEESRDQLQLDAFDPGGLDDESIAILDATELTVDRSFFENPGQLALIEPTTEAFRRWLIGAGATEPVAGSIAERLRRYFVSQLHEEWVKNSGQYAKLELYLVDSPFADATGRELAWLRYNAWLQKQIDEPLLGEPFSLRQTFVPLRAYWEQDLSTNDEVTPRHRAFRHIVELEDELLSWVDESDSAQAVRLLSGGPGSGKTSVCKMFCATLSERADLRVVFLPLHRLTFRRSLEEALAEFAATHRDLPSDFLSSSSRILLVFDGLDELALAGRASRELARVFVAEIRHLTERRNDSARVNMQVLLSGREVAIQEYAEELRRSRTLTLLGHAPRPKAPETFEPARLLEEDRREQWWDNFCRATGHSFDEIRFRMEEPTLEEVTNQPLLIVLLALAWFGENTVDSDLDQPWGLNSLYQTLIYKVYERRWGATHPTQAVLPRDKYVRVLEEIAVASWQSGESREVSRKQIEKRCKAANLETALRRFSEEASEGVTQLLTAFYFRKTEGYNEAGEMTFEFTHKSFAEYLIARRIRAQIGTLAALNSQHEENADIPGSPRDLLPIWAKLCGPETMEANLVEMLSGEVAEQADHDFDSVATWQSVLVGMFDELISRNYPMESLGLTSFDKMERQARNAEEALAVCMACCAEQLNKRSDVNWPSPRAARRWIYRVRGASSTEGILLQEYGLRMLNLSQQDLSFLSLRKHRLIGASLDATILDGAVLESVDLSEVSAQGASMVGASLFNSSLVGADLRHCRLNRALLEDSDLCLFTGKISSTNNQHIRLGFGAVRISAMI